jgi:hypothetical protein
VFSELKNGIYYMPWCSKIDKNSRIMFYENKHKSMDCLVAFTFVTYKIQQNVWWWYNFAECQVLSFNKCSLNINKHRIIKIFFKFIFPWYSIVKFERDNLAFTEMLKGIIKQLVCWAEAKQTSIHPYVNEFKKGDQKFINWNLLIPIIEQSIAI